MDTINVLIEQGRRKIEARRLQEQLANKERERKVQAQRDAEMGKFIKEAIEPLGTACEAINVGNLGEITEYTWEKSVPLSAPLCTTVHAEFVLEPTRQFQYPRENRTWELKRYLVPQVVLEKGADECEEPWSVYELFWSNGYLQATEIATLDEALALASDRFVEHTLLEQEAKDRNKAIKAERERHTEIEAKLIEAQLAAFVPFIYYQVTYGIMADEDGQQYADTGRFDSLSDHPGADGYWRTTRGAEKRVEHLVSVERKYVRFAEAMPVWCPRIDTPFGTIAGLPEGAERLEMGDT